MFDSQLQRIQGNQFWLRPLGLLLGAVGLVLMSVSLLRFSASSDAQLLSGLLALLWGAMLYLLCSYSAQQPHLPAKASWFSRIKFKLKRLVFNTMGLIVLLIALASVLLSLRLARLFLL
ncbi:hypothetical protein [Aliagarivorans marinus]|uniref:hypothetical protein n=1 Tax=Aliagarivorans marinus TaxID=561965 RepID=UPI0003FC203A|nr:hypothetical protein [Aliagarivorans marinus]